MKTRVYRGGKPRLKIYQYDSDFKYMRAYDTQTEVFDKYYGKGIKGRLFTNEHYKALPDGTYVSTYRIGRKGLEYWTRVYTSVYCTKYKGDKPFSAYNFLGEKVATFSNVRVFAQMTSIPYDTVVTQLHRYRKGLRQSTAQNGLTYKYDDTTSE